MKPQITVSQETQNFIECLVKIDDLYGSMSEAIKTLYGESQIDQLMSSDFDDAFRKLSEITEYYCMCSIRDNIATLNFERRVI